IELARHTITMALRDGRGYGDSREYYLDSDPSLLIAAGRIHMSAPDIQWLRRTWPWIRRATLRHLGKCDDSGLVSSPLSTGNRHQVPHGTSNAWDTVNSGHIDGYANAETYRAWKNVIGLAGIAGDDELRARV